MKKIISMMVFIALLVSAMPTLAAGPDLQEQDQPAGKKFTNDVYIVQMADAPVAAYTGEISGFAATKPAKGQKINVNDPKVVKYVGFLDSQHGKAMQAAGVVKKLYDYRYTFNGFAAIMTEAQAEVIRKTAGVLAVSKDEMVFADTSSTPTFLGLNADGGFWSEAKGEDVVIGVIDTGIWPESPSFSDRTGTSPSGKPGKLSYRQLPGWNGKCVPGEDFTAANCNQKLIGAQYFNAGWGGDEGIDALLPWEFNSARDYNGHGTHTSSTAGGNEGVATSGLASVFGTINGIAPRARIAMYKALWHTASGTGSGYTSDLVAAIDQAVADGVDVINYSISGTQTNFLDAVEISFLYAADAGVFVAASAGNSGPTTSTVAHPSPWITTVAAGTHNRSGNGSVTLGDGVTYYGPSFASAPVTAPLIDSINAGLPGADPTQVALCFSSADGGNVLDPAKVAGKIVVCDRGVTARVNKSLAVYEAGGVGMILLNPTASSLNADFHSVPTVHLQNTDYAAVHAYAATEGPTATINQAVISYDTPAPYTASFSSRGPLRAGGGDLLKPDVIAPGQDILAAVAPPGNMGMEFNLYSGTSMSSPHVAGLAALFKELKPTWSPMMIKSALMTSAYDVLDGPNTHPLVIFRQGAGHVQPNEAMDPGLVYNSDYYGWLAFLCGATSGVNPATCNALVGMGYSTDPSDLNMPSIAIGNLPGTQTVTRTVTNVSKTRGKYEASIIGLTGFNVEVTPSSLDLPAGASATFTVKITRTTAALNTYTGGYLAWVNNNGTKTVRIPVVVQPVALAAPVQVFGTGDPISYPVTFGYDGAFTATASGLVPAVTNTTTIVDDPDDTFTPVATADTIPFEVTIPAGTTYARFSLFDEFVSPASDLDLYVTNSAGTVVGSSGSGTSAEEVSMRNPAADTYTVWVHGWGVPEAPATFTLFSWVLGSEAAGNMVVTAPAMAVTGEIGTITLTFSGLAPATKYLGSVTYSGSSGMPLPTIVRVDVP